MLAWVVREQLYREKKKLVRRDIKCDSKMVLFGHVNSSFDLGLREILT